jgi:hypothetical protein
MRERGRALRRRVQEFVRPGSHGAGIAADQDIDPFPAALDERHDEVLSSEGNGIDGPLRGIERRQRVAERQRVIGIYLGGENPRAVRVLKNERANLDRRVFIRVRSTQLRELAISA